MSSSAPRTQAQDDVTLVAVAKGRIGQNWFTYALYPGRGSYAMTGPHPTCYDAEKRLKEDLVWERCEHYRMVPIDSLLAECSRRFHTWGPQ